MLLDVQPTQGHELPYAIKLNHIRDFGKRTEDNLTELEIQRIMEEMQVSNRKYEFFLKHKKSQKRQSIEETSVKPSKGKRKSPLINIFRRNRDEKKPHGKLFGHKLSDNTSPEQLIAKPVKELLTILFREGPYTIGILRRSCNARILKEVRQKLDDGEDCLTNDTWPSLVVGALVKDYLRNIPQSLLMENLFDDWIMANSCTDPMEKNNKLRDTLSKLPEPHYELLRHLMCVLYRIDQKSEENKMTAYNLSVCIAPSLLWPKGNNDPLATPPAIFQHMIKSCVQVFGPDSIHLFGDIVEQKMRQDSSTDSDSMHSVLSSHGNFRRDDSSLDSLDREILYSGEMDPATVTKSHFSPSNLSGDSGLISDSQYYEEDGNGNDIGRSYLRSTSYINPDVSREDIDQTSHSLDSQYFYQYDPQNPVPPPRRMRRKGSDQSASPIMDRKPSRYTSETVFNVPNRYNKRNNQNMADKFKRRSTESLKSVEESSEADSEMNMKAFRRPDIGTLFKSASGAHLYFEEPSLMEFDDINIAKNRRHLYKQSSEGAMPMSPQSKYSLSSSRDSVLSDSSGSYLNRQNSPDPLSSSAETPEQEESGMSAWLTQQSKHTAYTAQTHRQISHDDSEIGVKLDRKPTNKMNYLVSPKSSPKTSPKLRRRSPIPLAARKSFPLSVETSPKGSGSNTSKEAEDIITSPKLTLTYYSQDSLDKQGFETQMKDKDPSPHLDTYNNNAQLAMKQLNIYSSGLQGTSPPPRVVLQGLNLQSQTPRRENSPMKGNHEILPQARRNSFDTAQFIEHKQKYPMEDNSISSEEQDDSDWETETRIMTMINIPISYNIPQKILLDHSSSITDSLSRSSSQSEDLGVIRPENPPGYAEAVQRSKLLRQGLLSPEENSDVEVETVKQASLKAKQLYEQSMKQYQEQATRFSLPSQKFEKILDIHEEHVGEEDAGSITDSSEDEQPEYNPRKLYEESLKRYLEEQSSRSPLVKLSSADRENISPSKNKGGNLGTINILSPHGSSLHRSSSDAGDMKPRRSSMNRSRDTTPTRRPELPPPYSDPPPYYIEQTESSPHSARRYLFPLAGELITKSAATQKSIDVHISPKSVSKISTEISSSVNRHESSIENAQIVSVPKCRDNILVSNRARNLTNIAHSTESGGNNGTVHTSRITDYSIHSAQSEIGKYRSPVTNIRSRVSSTRSPSSSKSNSPITNVDHSKSNNVFRPRASSLEPQEPRATLAHPKPLSQGPISYRNPKVSSRGTEVAESRPPASGVSARRNSLDAVVSRHSIGVQKELPWSVKRLSNIFDATTPNDSHDTPNDSRDTPNDSHSTILQSHSSSSVLKTASSSHVAPHCTSPPTFQRYNDDIRSSISSNSSMSSSSTARSRPMSHTKHFNKFGPQARDSFSSADESDCSCRYPLNCRIDKCSVEELTDINFTDITYV